MQHWGLRREPQDVQLDPVGSLGERDGEKVQVLVQGAHPRPGTNQSNTVQGWGQELHHSGSLHSIWWVNLFIFV
jgi:hypothetical protein